VASKIFPMDRPVASVSEKSGALSEIGDEALEERSYDQFFLKHIQSVKADGAWYLNQHFIGKGGNGTTFFVTCTSGVNLGVQFALKVFHKISDDKRRERFLDEVRHYRSLSHPSIINVHDEGTFRVRDRDTGKAIREYPFAIMDYMPTTLDAKLGRGLPRITRLDAVRYVFNIASGVAYLHSQTQPIVHRDIKPSNILVNEHNARLGDLGLARVLMGDGNDEKQEDVVNHMAMPWHYRTPELVRIACGEKIKLTVASDIYQLGLVLYRSLTGYNPQKAPLKDVREEIRLGIRPIQGICYNRINLLLDQMLKEVPEERPTAQEVLRELAIVHREICQADFTVTGIMR